MPNVGEHHERLGVCPLCGSPSIRIRRQGHRHLLWRCRNCNGVFRTPEVAEYIIPPGDGGRGYVLAESIPQMERRGRLHEPRSAQQHRGRSLSRKLTTAAVVVILLGAVGYFIIFMAGLGRDSDELGQRSVSDESSLATDLQSPTPKPGLAVADTPKPILTATAEPAQAGIALAVATDTPVATPTSYPSSTPEPVPTVADTSTPSPSATAEPAHTSTATPIPTDTPVAVPTKTPIPTAVPQSSPTPMSTTPSVTVLSGLENGDG